MTNILNFLAKTALGLSDEAFYIILVKNHPNAAFLMQIPLKGEGRSDTRTYTWILI
jgi:hypothetical protein